MDVENYITKEKMIEILYIVFECIQSGDAESIGHLITELESEVAEV
jgi:hypothetical protein